MIPEEDAEADDSSLLAPPRLSMPLDEGELTARSVEIPREAAEAEHARYSRGSMGLLRPSGQFESLLEFDKGNESRIMDGDDYVTKDNLAEDELHSDPKIQPPGYADPRM